MKVVVIGAGIGGLTAAIALSRKNIDVEVFERADALRPVGASLALAPNAVRLMKDLSLLEPLREVAVCPEVVDWVRWDDASVLLRTECGPEMEAFFGAPQLDCFRPDVMTVLAEQLPAGALRLGQEIDRVEQTAGGVILHRLGEEPILADVAVAADGIRSAIRQQMNGDDHPMFSGMVAYRGVLDRKDAIDLHPLGLDRYWIGPDRHGVSYWLSRGERLAVTLAVRGAEPAEESWTVEAPTSEVLAYVEGWDAGLVERIRRCRTFIKSAVYVRASVDRWSDRRLTLLGDAAHAMEPTLGQGASQAVEDAYVLAECLAQDQQDPVAALVRYELIRLTRTKEQQHAAKAALTSYFLPDGEEQIARDAAWAELPKTLRFGPRQTIWQHDVRDTLKSTSLRQG